MNLAFPAQANTAALNQTAAGNNANGLAAGLMAFIGKFVRPMDGAELNFISADDVVAKDSTPAPRGLFSRLLESADNRQRRADESYLAEASDLYDLEYRSREIDRRARRSNAW